MQLTFERGLGRETAYRFWESKWMVAGIVAGFVILDVVDSLRGKDSASGVSTVLWAFLAIGVHNSILNEIPVTKFQTKLFWPFIWRSVVLSIPGIVFSVGISFYLIGDPTDRPVLFELYVMAIYGAATALIVGMWGTWLPAIVAIGGDRSFAAATMRGKAVFGYTFLRVLIGCGVVATGAVMFFFGALIAGHILGLDIEIGRGIVPYNRAIMAIFYVVIAFMFVMLPVILSRAYLLAEARQPRETGEKTTEEAPTPSHA